MNTLHAKSSCCHAGVVRYGDRRRQCRLCKRTWTVWKRKRGRRPIRIHPAPHTIAFASQESLRHRAARLHAGRECVRRRHASQLRLLLRTLAPPPAPSGALIAIIDGYQLFFGAQPWTVYLILLRPVVSSWATITTPCLLEGRETIRGREKAFAFLPACVWSQIRAVVVDGMHGVDRFARSQGWVLQRCHVHLLRILYPLLGNRFHSVRAKRLRRRAYDHVRTVLASSDEETDRRSITVIRSIAYSPQCPRRFGMKLRGFLAAYRDFRSYRAYPELCLPATTNAAEVVCGKIAEMVRRTRGFRMPRSFERWVVLLLRIHSRVRCNGSTINRHTVS